MAGLLEQAMQPAVLDESWRRLRNEHTPWSPTVDRGTLESHLLLHVLELRAEVLGGRYRPAPQRRFTMAKSDGGKRILSAQYLADKLIQRCLLEILQPRAEAIFHEDSFGYRPGRGVKHAMARVRERIACGQDWLVDADIEKFFDTIPHHRLIKVLKQFVADKPAMKLIEQWLVQGAHHSSLLRGRRGISQGAVLSPLMCNLYMHAFDTALARCNIPFVRFADDFLLFATTKKDAVAAKEQAGKLLERLGLRYHPRKTHVVRTSPQIIFLGEPLPRPRR